MRHANQTLISTLRSVWVLDPISTGILDNKPLQQHDNNPDKIFHEITGGKRKRVKNKHNDMYLKLPTITVKYHDGKDFSSA